MPYFVHETVYSNIVCVNNYSLCVYRAEIVLFLTPGSGISSLNYSEKKLPFPSGENIFRQFPAAALSVSWYLIRMKILGSEYGALGLVEHCTPGEAQRSLVSAHPSQFCEYSNSKRSHVRPSIHPVTNEQREVRVHSISPLTFH